MKVKDLIEELQKADPEAPLTIMSQDGCCGDHEFHEVIEAYFDGYERIVQGQLVRTKDFPHGAFLVYLTAAHGATSCRKSGMIHQAMREYEEGMAAWRKEQDEKSKT